VEKLTYLNTLFGPYSFKELIGLLINQVGFNTLFVILAAYIAAVVYFCTIPSKGRFSNNYAQSHATGFLQQVSLILSVLFLLIIAISGWASFFTVLIFFAVLTIPLFICVKVFSKDLTYEDYKRFRNPTSFATDPRWFVTKYGSISLVWLATVIELLAFFFYNPIIPLVGWAVITYALALSFLLAALIQSTITNASTCVFAKIITADGADVEGFIVSKGEDNYLVKTKECDFLLTTDYVHIISQAEPPK
jgi:hypothetical protein